MLRPFAILPDATCIECAEAKLGVALGDPCQFEMQPV